MFNKRNKLNINIALTLVCVITLSLCMPAVQVDAASKTSGSKNDYTVGDSITYGTLDGNQLNWTILTYDSSKGTALVVAKDPWKYKSITDFMTSLNQKYPDYQNRGFVTWNNSEWKTWLNGTFYKNAFTSSERNKILSTSFTKDSEKDSVMNFFHDTSIDAAYDRDGVKYSLDTSIYEGQSASTQYIFFLSSDEYTANKDTLGTMSSGEKWALRTSSYYTKNRTLCVDEANEGKIEPLYHYANTAIRPAMNLQLKDPSDKSSSNNASSSKPSTNTSSNTSKPSTNTSSNTSKPSTSGTTSLPASAGTVVNTRRYANNATDSNASVENKIILPSEGEYSMSLDSEAAVTLELDYLNASRKKYTVTYSSSDNGIFSVDSTGKITSHGQSGSAMLSVRMKKSNGKVYNMECRINVG